MVRLGPKSNRDGGRQGPTAYRCKNCGEALQLIRTHVSPPRLGAPSTTEFYACDACDSGYALNRTTSTWKPWMPDEA